jgi:hypothetical protein
MGGTFVRNPNLASYGRMNRALQRRNVRRSAARKIGGGFGLGPALVPIPTNPGGDWTYTQKALVNNGYDDCAFPARTGELFNPPRPDLAQAGWPLRGGRRTLRRGGAYSSPFYETKGEWSTAPAANAYKVDVGRAQVAMAGGGFESDANRASHLYENKDWVQTAHGDTPATRWGDPAQAQVGMAGGKRRRAATRKQRGGGCGCAGSTLFGGARRRRRTLRGGGTYGYAIDPSQSVGGSGPVAEPARVPVPCDARAGSDPAHAGPADPRAPADLYSLTTNQTIPSVQAGGAYSTGNGWSDACYKATGSGLPVYEAQTAGFHFYPSTATGGALPDGVTPFNTVVPHAARMGGARRRRRTLYRKRK